MEPPTNSGTAGSRRSDARVSGAVPRRGVAADELRRHNLGVVLERLHLSGPLSRSELATTTGLNRSTIADLLGELTDLGLIEQAPGTAPSGPGRPSPVVQIRPEGATVLAIELAVDSIAVATIGLGGHVYNEFRVARPRGRFSPDETALDVAKLAGPLLDSLPGTARSRASGSPWSASHEGPTASSTWPRTSAGETSRSRGLLARELELGVPVLAANEADLGALAEQRRGSTGGP